MGALLGECVDEGVPRDDVSVRHIVEHEVSVVQVEALGVHGDDGVAEERVSVGAGLDDVGVERSAESEVSEHGAAGEESEERLRSGEHLQLFFVASWWWWELFFRIV